MDKIDENISFLEKRVKEFFNEIMKIKEKNEEKNIGYSYCLGL